MGELTLLYFILSREMKLWPLLNHQKRGQLCSQPVPMRPIYPHWIFFSLENAKVNPRQPREGVGGPHTFPVFPQFSKL